MATSVSLSGPINSSITLSYGSTGLPIVSATDPKYPTGGYGGRLDANALRTGITNLQSSIDSYKALIKDAQAEITKIQLNSTLTAAEKDQQVAYYQGQIAGFQDKIQNFTNSITIANYLLSNLSSLLSRLETAQTSTSTSVSQPNAPNTQPPSVATGTTTTSTTTKTTSSPATTTSPSNTSTTTGSTTPVTAPATTTNPSNHLPMGNEIDDIYDPNLTPEQVASINPGDQKARADALGYAYTGPAVTPGEVDPNTGDIIVTAPGGQPDPATPLNQYDDWRVRLSLAPGADYLYRANDPGILAPLRQTNGVLFPYTPAISVNYAANYEQSTIIHSNYKVHQYSNSSVDNITITCDFTAQDTREANYLLAVIHFFRSVSKMFFGQDSNPRAGTPPPLCYLTGMGNYQFSEHPLAITGFTYNLPNDVDYIKTVGAAISGLELPANPLSSGRLPDNILPGGRPAPPDFGTQAVSPAQTDMVTWVPTKIQLSITGIPIISRNQMSQQFSLEKYATGALLNVKNSPDGGFW